MRVEKAENKSFQPVALVLETQEEIDKIFALFNFMPVIDKFEFGNNYKLLLNYKSDKYSKFHEILDEHWQR